MSAPPATTTNLLNCRTQSAPGMNSHKTDKGTHPGIGRQVAISFAAEGCRRIAILDRDEDGLTETAKLCKAQSSLVRTFIIPFDVRNDQDVTTAMDCVIEEWGRIDYAVNCAGTAGRLLTPCFIVVLLPSSAFWQARRDS